MTETGRIREIHGNTITIARETDAACCGCADKECKATAFSYTADNTAGLPLQPGQLVETETAASPLKQGLTVLLPPILGFTAGYVLTGVIFPASAEPPRAAAGVLFLFVTALALYLFRSRHPPKIVRRVLRVVEGTV